MKIWWIACVVLLAAFGCSSGAGEPEQARTVDPTTTTVATPTTTAVDPGQITEGQLAATLLTLEDMPTGFSTLPPEPEDDQSSFCNERRPSTEVPRLQTAQAQFAQNPTTGPFLGSVAAVHPTLEEAGRYLDVLLEVATECAGPYPTPGDEEATTTSIAPLSFDNYGDDTVALRFTYDNDILSGSADVVYVQVGPVIFQVGEVTTLGGGDVARLQGLIETQLQRTEALLLGSG